MLFNFEHVEHAFHDFLHRRYKLIYVDFNLVARKVQNRSKLRCIFIV